MIIFKAFLQILNKNKGILITYSLILIIFSLFSLKSNEATVNFAATKPDIYIINHDLNSNGQPSALSESLVHYLAERSNLIELKQSSEQSTTTNQTNDSAESLISRSSNANRRPVAANHADEQIRAHTALDDAIFYRHVNFALEIPANFETDFLAGQNPAIVYKSSGDYNASLAAMNLSRYLELANAYLLLDLDAPALASQVTSTLSSETPVELLSHADSGGLARAAYYYNFMNYPLLVGCIFMICLVFLSFRGSKISSRLAIGAIPQAKINRILLGANLLFAFALWGIYVALSFVVVGRPMLSGQGMLLIFSSFIFTICVVALAFLLANLIKNRNVLNGIVNVVGLGSSFLCGVFVPLVWLPDSVRVIAHALLSFWYVSANDRIVELESFSWENLLPVLGCLLVVLIFALAFVILTNLVSIRQKHQKSSQKCQNTSSNAQKT